MDRSELEQYAQRPLPLPADILDAMANTQQNPRYHAEGDVLAHTQQVIQAFVKEAHLFDLTDHEVELMYWTCVLHDTGKIHATKWEQGRWRAKGHAAASVPIARSILLEQPHLSTDDRETILRLIYFHSIPLVWGLQKSPTERYKRIALQVDLRLLGIFTWFDLKGRICENPERVMELAHRFHYEIRPQIEEQLGTFQSLTSEFRTKNRMHKNALWSAANASNFTLVEKLLASPSPIDSVPQYPLLIMQGGTVEEQKARAAQFFPAYKTYVVEALGPIETDKHSLAGALRQLRHFLSVYGRSGQPLAVLGMPVDIKIQSHIIEFARGANAVITFEKMEQAGDPEERMIHPWQVHKLEYLP
ncbi:HD domain-containing protein [Pontibacter sp. G13]|uniref:HD domain-containing protein n=1 Tax=Pontibacter sp. G13 TaxID=3074898 RepID=UPI00288AF77B|nr:HD domain-containing protein [Pontibacter sp. G13]WNJ16211.1 HD domain-containing protein [Pontibacter sp. G13]